MNEPGIVQILIFHPDCGKRRNENKHERTDSRQQYINLSLERAQVDDNAVVRDIVLGTNNFVYAVLEYPADELNMKEESRP